MAYFSTSLPQSRISPYFYYRNVFGPRCGLDACALLLSFQVSLPLPSPLSLSLSLLLLETLFSFVVHYPPFSWEGLQTTSTCAPFSVGTLLSLPCPLLMQLLIILPLDPHLMALCTQSFTTIHTPTMPGSGPPPRCHRSCFHTSSSLLQLIDQTPQKSFEASSSTSSMWPERSCGIWYPHSVLPAALCSQLSAQLGVPCLDLEWPCPCLLVNGLLERK